MKTKEKRKERVGKKRRDGGFVILLTQSAVIVCLQLAALLFRLIGGTAYEQLRSGFSAAIGDNTFTEAVVSLFLPQEESAQQTD